MFCKRRKHRKNGFGRGYMEKSDLHRIDIFGFITFLTGFLTGRRDSVKPLFRKAGIRYRFVPAKEPVFKNIGTIAGLWFRKNAKRVWKPVKMLNNRKIAKKSAIPEENEEWWPEFEPQLFPTFEDLGIRWEPLNIFIEKISKLFSRADIHDQKKFYLSDDDRIDFHGHKLYDKPKGKRIKIDDSKKTHFSILLREGDWMCVGKGEKYVSEEKRYMNKPLGWLRWRDKNGILPGIKTYHVVY